MKEVKKQEIKEGSLEEKNLSTFNRINFPKEFIKINKNQILFGSLTPSIKYIFSQSLKELNEKDLMKKVFYRWKDEDNLPSSAQKYQLRDEDGISLIWKMQRCIVNNQIEEKESALQEEGEMLRMEEAKLKTKLKNVEQKETKVLSWKVHAQEKKKLLEQINEFKKHVYEELASLQGKIKSKEAELEEIRSKNDYHFNAPQMNFILTKTISKEIRNLIKESISFIVQTSHPIMPQGESDDSIVYVVFEQAYETKLIKKSKLVRLIGSSCYLQKVQQFNTLMQTRMLMSPEEKLNYGNFHCCHRCMKIYPKQALKFCHTSINSLQTNSYPSSDYFTYRQVLLQGDFFSKSTDQHIIPFFIYHKNEKNQYKCNRAFCEDCRLILMPQKNKKTPCFYCRGICGCNRCEKAVGIVKLIALDYHHDPFQQKKYHDKLKIFSEGYSGIEGNLSLRSQVGDDQALFLQQIWQGCQRSRLEQRVNLQGLKNIPIKQTEQNISLSFIDQSGMMIFNETWTKMREKQPSVVMNRKMMEEEGEQEQWEKIKNLYNR